MQHHYVDDIEHLIDDLGKNNHDGNVATGIIVITLFFAMIIVASL